MANKDRQKYNAYMNDYMKRRYKQRRELMLSILGDSCSKCGSVENLQVDHIYWVDKEFNFSKYWNCSLKVFLSELSKCQVLCSECHKEKSKVDVWDRRLNEGGANQYGPY